MPDQALKPASEQEPELLEQINMATGAYEGVAAQRMRRGPGGLPLNQVKARACARPPAPPGWTPQRPKPCGCWTALPTCTRRP